MVVLEYSNLGDPWDSHIRCQSLVGEVFAISKLWLWSNGIGDHADFQRCGEYSNQR